MFETCRVFYQINLRNSASRCFHYKIIIIIIIIIIILTKINENARVCV